MAYAATAILAACAGGGAPTAYPPVLAPPTYATTNTTSAQSLALTMRDGALPALDQPAEPQRSWVDGGLAHQSLLYISIYNNKAVEVFTYEQGFKRVGELTGFTMPYGACSDKHGNVFVTDYLGAAVKEFAHGATHASKTLRVRGALPIGCSVDPTTGNLAVSNFITYSGEPGVAVYHNASGKPQKYFATGDSQYLPPSYDDTGNLFVEAAPTGGVAELLELARGSSKFTPIKLSHRLYFAAGVQWDGEALAVGDQMYDGTNASGFYRVKITSQRGTVVGSAKFDAACGQSDIVQFWIQATDQQKHVVGPDTYCGGAGLYAYPAGGKPSTVIVTSEYAFGATVSVAQ